MGYYMDLCPPTITLAVGLKPCVVLQPTVDTSKVVIIIATIILTTLLE